MKTLRNQLTSRERFLLALSHQETDRVPVDLGGLSSTIRTVDLYQRLRSFLNLVQIEKYRHFLDEHIILDEDILKIFEVDTRYIRLGAAKNWHREKIDRYTVKDEWGTIWTKPPHFIYASIIDHPIKESSLEALRKFKLPDPLDPGRYEGLHIAAKDFFTKTQYAIVADYPTGAGVFDQVWRLRGMSQLMIDMLDNADFCQNLFDTVGDWFQKVYEHYMREVGPYVQMVMIYDDLAMQEGPFVSSDLYRKYIRPQHKKLLQAIRNHTDAMICIHICGSAYSYIPDFVEMGINVINPVQIRARNMSPEVLKAEFGDKLSFHGGVDSQELLPGGSPDEITEEVRRLIRILGKKGGYLLAPCHSIQPDVSPENIKALFSANRALTSQ